MTSETLSPKLPTEFFDEKTFYTFGGATAAVFLTSWVISYFLPECFPVKIVHLIVLFLSEGIAFIIMSQKRKVKKIKYLFAFLNGLLIFVNVNGLNQMTFDHTCVKDSSDSVKHEASMSTLLKNQSLNIQKAGLIALPGMANWWPDEKLINQNFELEKEKARLTSENRQLRALMESKTGMDSRRLTNKVDSLSDLTNSLKRQLVDKQKQIDECNQKTKELERESQKFADCIHRINSKSDSLITCIAQNNKLEMTIKRLNLALEYCENERSSFSSQTDNLNRQVKDFRQTISSLNTQIERFEKDNNTCNVQLERCVNQRNELNQRVNTLTARIETRNSGGISQSLTEHLIQTCRRDQGALNIESINNTMTLDERLMRQDFWITFCTHFNRWIRMQNSDINNR